MQLSALGSQWSNNVDAVQAALQQNNPPLSIAGSAAYKGGSGTGDFDEAKYKALYPDVQGSALAEYTQSGFFNGRTFTPTDAWQAKSLQQQFAQADFIAAKALQAAGVTGANFDSAAFTAAHQGEPTWYATWSPWQYYIYYGLPNGYPFPLMGGNSTVVSTGSTAVSTPQTTAANASGSVTVQTGVTPWMTWLVSQVPSMQGQTISTSQALAYANQYASLPVSSSAVLNTAPPPVAAPTSSYSPFQTNYAVSPGIPDTGEPGIPGTGTGAPSAPATYDQVKAATAAATAPAASKKTLLIFALVAAGGFGAYYYSKNKAKINRAIRRH